MQKMNIYCDMYEGHDLKMVAGMDSDSLLFDPWPQAFLGTMEPDERRRFLDAYRDRNNEFYSKSALSRRWLSGSISVICRITWVL